MQRRIIFHRQHFIEFYQDLDLKVQEKIEIKAESLRKEYYYEKNVSHERFEKYSKF
jgi:hypothetical protein